jgi:hypothetical protein
MATVGHSRALLTGDELTEAVEAVTGMLSVRAAEKGMGAYASRHETLGIIEEEKAELVQAVTSGDIEAVVDELIDIAVGCVFGIASLRTGKADW